MTIRYYLQASTDDCPDKPSPDIEAAFFAAAKGLNCKTGIHRAEIQVIFDDGIKKSQSAIFLTADFNSEEDADQMESSIDQSRIAAEYGLIKDCGLISAQYEIKNPEII